MQALLARLRLSRLWPFGSTPSDLAVAERPAPPPAPPPELEPVRFIGRPPPMTDRERFRAWHEDALAGFYGVRVAVPPPPAFSAWHGRVFEEHSLHPLFFPGREPVSAEEAGRTSSKDWAPFGRHVRLNSSIGPDRDLERIPLSGRWGALEVRHASNFGEGRDPFAKLAVGYKRKVTHGYLMDGAMSILNRYFVNFGGTVTVPSVEETVFARNFFQFLGRRDVTDQDQPDPWGGWEWARNRCDQGQGALVVKGCGGIEADRRWRDHTCILGADIPFRIVIHF